MSTMNAIATPIPRRTDVQWATNVATGPGVVEPSPAPSGFWRPENHAMAAINSASTTIVIADARRNEVIWSQTAPAAAFGSFLPVMASR